MVILKFYFISSPLGAISIEKAVFGVYLVIAIIILINTLIAMLAVTYEKIEKQSDIEWKFGRAKLIRNLTKASTDVPVPFMYENLLSNQFSPNST